jgi:5-methylcytosine-specific restriction endonuclease McrA
MMVPKPNHNRRVPKRGDRSKFSKQTRHQVYERENGLCQNCGGRGSEVHHVFPRSRSGRNVITNALLLCDTCHRLIHKENALMDFWIDKYTDIYGEKFWHDEYD